MNCPSRRNVIQKRTSWLSISILILAFYSTAFSGVYLVAAFVKPRFGKGIGAGGMAPSTASLLSAFFAKTIELTFVTVFVAFLGQVLTRRSLSKRAHGVTIAEMSMRGWIMQPGTLITHWENVRYAGLSFLGMTSLTAALMALLYTTAAETLGESYLLQTILCILPQLLSPSPSLYTSSLSPDENMHTILTFHLI